MLKYAEVKDWDDETIDKKLEGLRRELFDLRMQRATSSATVGQAASVARKMIARLLTAKRQRKGEGLR